MKQKTFLIILLFISIHLNAQTERIYESLIAEAGLLHLQKDYNKAIQKFEKALSIKNLDALNLYKLASAYSLANKSDKAFYYIEQAIENGWTEADLLITDPYFNNLKNEFHERWNQIEIKAYNSENKYEATLKYPQLRRQINLMALQDQKLRFRKVQTNDNDELQKINEAINISDFQNLNKAKEIIKTYGWPGISDIGKDGENNFWLIVQHADQDIKFQKLALSEMEKHIKTKEIDLENYAFLYDRVQCNLNYRQLYGTQVIWTQNGQANGFRPILKENLVNSRRKSLGLLPLDLYALNYGFSYNEISSKEALENERKDKIETEKLINAAKLFYKTGTFQKTYDYYNTASTIMDGMSDEQSYEAAVVFAKIYNINHEEQYRGIALDFLTLEHYRNKLDKIKLKTKKEFKSFYKQDRWISLINEK